MVRVPQQENYPGESSYGIDWIELSTDQLTQLQPLTGGPSTYNIPDELAKELLIQFRLPLETKTDLDEQAKTHVTKLALVASRVETQGDHDMIALKGMLRLEDRRELSPHEVGTDKWILPVEEELHISGYLHFNAQSKALQEAKFSIDSAYFIPPDKKKISFVGIGHLLTSIQDL